LIYAKETAIPARQEALGSLELVLEGNDPGGKLWPEYLENEWRAAEGHLA
jgi:hypothetical protein